PDKPRPNWSQTPGAGLPSTSAAPRNVATSKPPPGDATTEQAPGKPYSPPLFSGRTPPG
ncbi:unnamed protein product, partial [Didymodactylos carnosus]